MKKVIFALIFLLGITSEASAQIIQSTASKITVIKETTPPTQSWWTIKLGGGALIDEGEATGTYNVSIGYNKYLKNSSFYWNITAGSSMLNTGDSHSYGTIFLGPSMGIKKHTGPNSSVMFDAHLGCSAEFVPDEYSSYNLGVSPELGAGLWFNRFLIEIDYRPGIIAYTCNQRFLLNLGWKF